MTLATPVVLEPTPLAAELTNAELGTLAGIVTVRDLEDGEVLIEEGKSDSTLHVVVSGSISVSRRDPRGDWNLLYSLRPGELVGELSFMDNEQRYASLVAYGPTRVIALRREDLESLLDSHPRLVYKVMRNVMRVAHAVQRRLSVQMAELQNYIFKTGARRALLPRERKPVLELAGCPARRGVAARRGLLLVNRRGGWGRRSGNNSGNRAVAFEPLAGVEEPLLDVPAESLDLALPARGQSALAEDLLFRRRHAPPPLEPIQPRRIEIRKGDREAPHVAPPVHFREREIILERPRQIDGLHHQSAFDESRSKARIIPAFGAARRPSGTSRRSTSSSSSRTASHPRRETRSAAR
jgi:CRP-like cAMP-binding protein